MSTMTLYLCPNPECPWREVLGRGSTPWPGGTCECGTGGAPVRAAPTGPAPEPPNVAAPKRTRARKSR